MREVRAVAIVTAYFAACFLTLGGIKALVLADYGVKFRACSVALLGALVAAKVVMILQHVPLGGWVRRRPVAVDVVLRALLYTLGVGVVLTIEKAFEVRRESGGFAASLGSILHHRDMPEVAAKTIAIGGAMLGFVVLSVLGERFGWANLRRLFFTTSYEEFKRESGAARGPHERANVLP